MSLTARERSLARTYGPGAVDRVAEYRLVEQYLATHPQQGSSAVANALGLPRSRIRLWVDGDGRPAAVKAIRTADDRGWFDARPGSPAFTALVRCHAWIFAGGAIAASNYRPSFTINGDDPEALITESLETLGLQYRTCRPAGADADGRGTEIRPTDDGVLLGRFLVGVLDAPRGRKNRTRPDRVPFWVGNATEPVRREWCRVYVALRGVTREDQGGAIQLSEERTARYRASLRDLLRSVVDREEAITCTGTSGLRIEPPATDRVTARPPETAGNEQGHAPVTAD